MPRGVVPIRASEEEKALWDEAAHKAGLRFSAWARRVLNEQCAFERSIDSDEGMVRNTAASPILEIPRPAHRCPPKGMYCKFCNKIV